MAKRSFKDIIDSLRQEITDLKVQHRKDLTRVRAEGKAYGLKKNAKKGIRAYHKARKKIGPTVRAKAKIIQQKAKEDIYEKAVKIADKRFETMTFRNVVYIDGYLCFPIIMSYSKHLDITPWAMNYLILYNIIKDGKFVGLDKYGLKKLSRIKALHQLIDKGYMEKFGELKGTTYVPTVRGRRAFLDFREYYREQITRGLHNERLTTRHKWE